MSASDEEAMLADTEMDDVIAAGEGQEDGLLQHQQSLLPIVKRQGVGKENVDLILFAREKKWAFPIPSIPQPQGARMRVALIEEGDDKFDHLVGEANGTLYRVGLCARPELEVHLVGVGARSLVVIESETVEEEDPKAKKGKKGKKGKPPPKPKPVKGKKGKKGKTEEEPAWLPTDQSDGKGIEVLYNPVTSTYILSQKQEDELVLLFRNDFAAALTVHAAFLRYYDTQVNCMTTLTSRVWRRFVRLNLMHKITDEAYYEELTKRWIEARKKAEEANRILSVDDLSSSSSDSNKSDQGSVGSLEPKPKKKKEKEKDKDKDKAKSKSKKLESDDSDTSAQGRSQRKAASSKK